MTSIGSTRNAREFGTAFRHGNVSIRISINGFEKDDEKLLDRLLATGLRALGDSIVRLSSIPEEQDDEHHCQVQTRQEARKVTVEVTLTFYLKNLSSSTSCLATLITSDILKALVASADVDGARSGVAAALIEFGHL